MGSPPENATFHLAFSPALTMTDSENLTSVSEPIFGGSTNLKTKKVDGKPFLKNTNCYLTLALRYLLTLYCKGRF